jgi:hypothetical protein
MNFLKGKKTYILVALGVIYALSGYFTGHFDLKSAIDMVWTALAAGTIRAGISNG